MATSMAQISTRSDSIVTGLGATVVCIRQWVGFIENLFLAGGWVKTSDTGQATTASMSACTLAPQAKGYHIFRMNDALQSTAPVFVKIEYGCGSFGTGFPAVWITIGTGSNGSGTITGVKIPRVIVHGYPNGNGFNVPETTPSVISAEGTCFGSAAPNRVAVVFGAMETVSHEGLTFAIERGQDVNGNDNSDVAFMASGSGRGTELGIGPIGPMSQYATPTRNFALSLNVIGAVPTGASLTTASFSGESNTFGVCPIRLFAGQPSNPIRSLVMYTYWDAPAGQPLNMPMYGVSHAYMPCGRLYDNVGPRLFDGNPDGQASYMMLWE